MSKLSPKIAKKDLKHGSYYSGESSYGEIARWNAITNCFRLYTIYRGKRILANVKHPEDEQLFDAFIVKEECNPKEYIPLGSVINNKFLKRLVTIKWLRIKRQFQRKILSTVDIIKEPQGTQNSPGGMGISKDLSIGDTNSENGFSTNSVIPSTSNTLTHSSLKEKSQHQIKKSH